MNKRFFALTLMVHLALSLLAIRPSPAQAEDMFPGKAAAEKRARELKCSGAFAMGHEWMPCQNFDAYQKAIKQQSS